MSGTSPITSSIFPHAGAALSARRNELIKPPSYSDVEDIRDITSNDIPRRRGVCRDGIGGERGKGIVLDGDKMRDMPLEAFEFERFIVGVVE